MDASGLSKQDYLAIQARLDLRPRFWPTVAMVVFDVACLVVFSRLVHRSGVASFLLSQLVLTVVFFNSFSLLHECGHGSASPSTWFNTVLGHLASTFCLIPYFPWKYIHQKHHLWTGNLDHDPVLKSLRKFRDDGVPGLVRVAWRSWVPLAGLLQHVVFLTYPLDMYRHGDLTRPKLLRCVLSALWMPASVAFLWGLFPETVRLGNVALGLVMFLFLEELVNLPHHVGMPTFAGTLPLWQQYRATRSCNYPLGLSELVVLNFNFHIEHHLFPTLPWYRLRRARGLCKAALGEAYEESVGISWNVRNRTRDLDTIVDRYRKKAA